MQISLFDDNNTNRLDFQESLAGFDLTGANKILDKWQKKLDAPKNLKEKKKALADLNDFMEKERQSLKLSLAELWLSYKEASWLKPLRQEFKHLFRGINKILSSHLSAQDFDFLLPGLHPAQVFIETENYLKAEACLAKYLREIGEHSFIRQLQGFVFLKQGREKDGLVAYTFALFNNPLQLSFSYLLPRDFKNKFLFLQKKMGGQEKGWLHLPFSLWRDGKTYIDPGANHFEIFLREKIEQEQTSSLSDPSKKIICFLHLLYLSEMIRLRHNAPGETNEVRDLHIQIQKINPEFLNTYKAVLRSYRNL